MIWMGTEMDGGRFLVRMVTRRGGREERSGR